MKKIINLIIICLFIILLPVKVFAINNNIYKDELTPVDGVYKITSIVGLENMHNHLDGSFEIINDIDCKGANWLPLGDNNEAFKGTLICNEFVVSNLVIDKSIDGNIGFFGNNEGYVDKLFLENIEIICDEDTKNISLFASNNAGTFNRCNGQGELNLDKVNQKINIGGLAVNNSGSFKNSIVKLDIEEINNELEMNVGGLVVNNNGSVRDCETHGALVFEDNLNKNIGLLVTNNNGDVKRCAFMGEKNYVGNELYETPILINNNKDKTSSLLIRQNGNDDVSEESRKLRNEVVDYMYQMGSILWTTNTQIQTSCVPKCNSQQCHTPLDPGTIYRGFPYKHSSSTLDRMQYCLNDDNSLKQWVIDLGNVGGFQTYFGSACYSSIQLAWARVSNTVNATCAMEALLHGDVAGTLAVGKWRDNWKYRLNEQYSQYCIDLLGIDAILEDYALVRAGDAFVKLNSSGAHAIMAASDVVVVRDENGKIDPEHSYLYTHEQGGPNNAPDGIVSSWCLNRYKTFTTLLGEAYLPITTEELVSGKKEEVEIKIEDDLDGILGLTTGIIKSNHYIDALTIDIKENNQDFFNKKVYCRVDNIKDYDDTVAMFDRNFVKEYDLALLSKSIQDLKFNKHKNYHVTMTLLLQNGQEIIVKEFDF